MGKKITVTKVTNALDISVRTLDNWYRYYNDPTAEKPDDMPELPAYEQSSLKGIRYWDEEDLPKIKEFKEWVPRGRAGLMGRTNERYWSKEHRKNKKQEVTTNDKIE